MASNIVETVRQGPRQCESAFFVLTEITHAKNHSTVMSWIKNSKPTWMTWHHIVRIRVNIDIAFWDFYTIIIEFFYRCIEELEVHDPGVQNRRVILWNHQMCTSCELFIETNDSLCSNPFFIATIIDSITCNISKFHFIDTFITNNATSFCITTCSLTIISNKHFCIRRQALF